MIEATCGACGTLNRISEADVPSGAKYVTCASCKSRVVVPAQAAAGLTLGGLPPAGGGRGDVIDLADLPAPKKRGSSLQGADASRPAPQSALAGVELDDLLGSKPSVSDLPAPKARPGMQPPPIPKAVPQTVADLPAPKSQGGLVSGTASRASIDDLPAPKSQGGLITGAPRSPQSIGDLPTPKSTRGLDPSGGGRTSTIGDLPAPKATAGISDLPTPKGPNSVADLPMPKGQVQQADLPAPRGASRQSQAALDDLPAPKARRSNAELRPKGPGSTDLPMPKGNIDLPMPKAGQDLPAPKGFFDDLPQPAHGGGRGGGPDLPAPKGFFDDLPQPAQSRGPDLPAPKGFFDDLPQSASNQPGGLPAPKGFFDDLPQAASNQPAGYPAPKGFFDDLPQRAGQSSGLPAPLGYDEGLKSKGNEGLSSADLFGGRAGSVVDGSNELDMAPPGRDTGYDNVDLAAPSATGVKFDSSGKRQSNQMGDVASIHITDKPVDSYELDPDPKLKRSARLQPKHAKDQAPVEEAQPEKVAKPKRSRSSKPLIALFGIMVVGGVGYLGYTRYLAAQERATLLQEKLALAGRQLHATAPGHWLAATTAANTVLQEFDEENAEAISIAAEAGYGGALEEGVNATAREAKARQLTAKAREIGITSEGITRAIALESLVGGQLDIAMTRLKPLLDANPKDGFLWLYKAWILMAQNNPAEAVKAYDAALAANAGLKLTVLYWRGRAKLVLADLAGARADFTEELAGQKDHIGAQVELAAAMPSTQATQQEADLLAILQRKDIDQADPRVRVEAWVLAGDDARRAGRVDAARERYRKALEITPNEISATTGLAEAELRDGKLDVANDLVTKATTQSPNDVRAQLVATELEIKLNKLDNASKRIKLLSEPTRALTTLEQVRLGYVTGRLLDAQGDDNGALDKWSECGKLAGDFDLSCTMAAIGKLGKLQKKALDDKNPDAAAQFRTRAGTLLGVLEDKANSDPSLGLTLGIAYLDSNDPAKAEAWCRKAAEAKPSDPEAKYQLAKALGRLGRPDDAIEQLRAAIEIDPSRSDIGLELARTYEAGGRDPDAAAMYDKLLAKKDPSVELRARAGRFYARTEQNDKAAAQADEILKADPFNPAGFYLKGEKLLGEGRYEDAKKFFQQAVDADRDAQYLDGQGRCAEKMADIYKDSKFQELALRAYQAAAELAPTMFSPHAGQGRLYIKRGEWAKAVPELDAAYKLKPEDYEVLYAMGIALQKQFDLKSAVEWFKRANQVKPSGMASYKLGVLYSDPKLHDDKNAAVAFQQALTLLQQDEDHGGLKPLLEGNDNVDPISDTMWLLSKIYESSAYANPSEEKRLLLKFLNRHPKDMQIRVDEANKLLSTTLRGVP